MRRVELIVILVCALFICCTFQLDHKYEETGQTCEAGSETEDCEVGMSIKKRIEKSLQTLSQIRDDNDNNDKYIHVIITFKNAEGNRNLQQKFGQTVRSMLSKSSVGIIFMIIGDTNSQSIAREIISEEVDSIEISTPYQVAELDAELMAKELHGVVEPMQRYFSHKPGAYYSDSLFFLSIAIHNVMPNSLEKVIMLDADLKFKTDINQLYNLFTEFTDDAILGIARENQPVYRHLFSRYRSENRGTQVGDPPSDGLTGFNSGVLLLNLQAMRSSKLYNSLLNEETLKTLTQKYHFKGHLGDQDFFTLISMEYEELFYILPCGWNRQLCVWWRDHGYEAVFSQYYDCNEPTHIYHGNCNTPIPDD